jgi:hypothetical protein
MFVMGRVSTVDRQRPQHVRVLTFTRNVARKASPLVLGLGIAALGGVPLAFAANGYHYIVPCANCQTTADFIQAAGGEAVFQEQSGHYQVISTSQPATAYIHVIMKMVNHGGEPIWTVQSATPVDSAGNSLVGNAEVTNESYFASLDQTIFGVSRSAPTVLNEPTNYASSFINSLEEETEPGINAALAAKGISPGTIAVGTVITLKFEDGTTAQYIKISSVLTTQWQWTGIAHDAQGRLMHRDGSLVANPNTAGSGGGSMSAPGFGAGHNWNFNVSGRDLCTMQTTITVNGESTGYVYFSPC